MEGGAGPHTMLHPYRVLDLTDEKGLLCGKLLSDLGADVIKIERPQGDPARRIGPFYHDEADPEKSLFWFAFNTGKRGITLDIETAEGQAILKRLAAQADFLIESFPPGYMDGLGLGYPEMEKLNPRVIMVSISPFGQTGPFRSYKGPDIVAWAMGGQTALWGDVDRPPVRIGYHSQAHLHGAAEAAVGAMTALHHRHRTGRGQHVDVSIQEAVGHVSLYFTAFWDMMGINMPRNSGLRANSKVRSRFMWPCKDGYVIWIYWGGLSVPWNLPLVEWMEAEGMADDFLRNFDWASLDYTTAEQETVDRLEEPTARFFLSHTKAELWEGALRYRAQLYPVSTAADAMESIQLAHRKFWVEVTHPELGRSITYPGAFGIASQAPIKVSQRAPRIGEHNEEVLHGLALSGTSPQGPIEAGAGGKAEAKPLQGLRVVDFGWNITGPLTAKLLSDCGALVIEIESEKRLDPLRSMGPFKDGVPGLNRSGIFNQWNTCKLGVTLNLAHPKGVEVARRLAAWADVVLENFSGGAMKRMGLGYEVLSKLNPGIIMLSSCMQGQEGPYANHPGTGHQLTGLAGFNHITGWPDRDPPYLSSYTDFPAPRLNALAILAALEYRNRTGKGQYLDMSQLETGMHFLAPVLLDYAVNGRVADRMGNRCPHAAPHNAYRCLGQDRWCTIAAFSHEEWESLCAVTGHPEWMRDPRFGTLERRKENEEALDVLVERWTGARTAEEVMHRMQQAGVPAGIVQTAEDMLDKDPQLKHRGFYWEFEHPEMGRCRAPRPSFVLSKAPYALRRAPLMGEHNEYVLKNTLSMSDDDIADLIVEGVLQ